MGGGAELALRPPEADDRSAPGRWGGDLVVGAGATGFDVYFCDPAAPWQRGANENANGLLGRFFPKGADFSLVTGEAVREAQDQPNGRPRKTLGWSARSRTPETTQTTPGVSSAYCRHW